MSVTPSPAPPPSPEPSARELDAEIARRVFYWMDVRSYPDIGMWGTPTTGPSSRPVPHYSTDPAARDEVVEAMRARGLTFELSSPYRHCPQWEASFRNEHLETVGCGYADTPGRAVCLAALAALAAASPEGTVPRA